MTLTSIVGTTIDSLMTALRRADLARREAEAGSTDPGPAAAARAKVRTAQQDLRAAHLRQREAALAVADERLRVLADEGAALDDKAADLAVQLARLRDRRGLVERKITAARAGRDRVRVQAARRVTVRLDAVDRVVPPAECQLLDPAVWIGIIVDAKTKGVNGAWAADLVFDERTGRLVGETRFHYDPSDAERQAGRDQAGRSVAERRARLAQHDPSGGLQRDAEATLRQTAPRPGGQP